MSAFAGVAENECLTGASGGSLGLAHQQHMLNKLPAAGVWKKQPFRRLATIRVPGRKKNQGCDTSAWEQIS